MTSISSYWLLPTHRPLSSGCVFALPWLCRSVLRPSRTAPFSQSHHTPQRPPSLSLQSTLPTSSPPFPKFPPTMMPHGPHWHSRKAMLRWRNSAGAGQQGYRACEGVGRMQVDVVLQGVPPGRSASHTLATPIYPLSPVVHDSVHIFGVGIGWAVRPAGWSGTRPSPTGC